LAINFFLMPSPKIQNWNLLKPSSLVKCQRWENWPSLFLMPSLKIQNFNLLKPKSCQISEQKETAKQKFQHISAENSNR
jgi:hypothetical protein